MASASQSMALRTRSHTVPQVVQFADPQNADLVLKLEPGGNKPTMLLHTSMATVKTHFKDIEIGDRKYTADDPLSLTETNNAAFVLLMKMAYEKPVTEEDVDAEDQSVDEKGLRRVAEMAAKYKYEGPLPAWIAERLKKQLYFDDALFPQDEGPKLLKEHDLEEFDARDEGKMGEGFIIWKVIEVFCLSLAFGFEDTFARASRQLTWLLRPIDFAWFDDRHPLYEINKMHFVKKLYDAHIELRKTLLASLPPVLYPDPQGSGPGGCRKCNAVPHFRRWCEELWASEDFMYFLDALPPHAEYAESCSSLYSTFNMIFLTMLYEFKRDDDEDADKPLPCGRFRVRMSCLRELEDQDSEHDDSEEDDREEQPDENAELEDASGEIADREFSGDELAYAENGLTGAEEEEEDLDETWKDEWREVQLMEDVYDSIGGLCLKCFKEGDCKYQQYCKKHKVLLGL